MDDLRIDSSETEASSRPPAPAGNSGSSSRKPSRASGARKGGATPRRSGNSNEITATVVEEDWTGSPERIKNLRNRMISLAVMVACGGGAYAIWFLRFELGWSTERALLVITPLGIITTLAYMYALVSISSARARFRGRQQKEAQDKLGRSFGKLRSDLDLSHLIQLNREQMDAYHLLTKGQASDSFKYSQIASGTSLFVLLLGASVAILGEDALTKTLAAALAALGTALSGYIARTHMRMYERALQQLNFYFEQPLIYSYLLTAERIAKEMPDEHKFEVRKAIADRILECAFTKTSLSLNREGSKLPRKQGKSDTVQESAVATEPPSTPLQN